MICIDEIGRQRPMSGARRHAAVRVALVMLVALCAAAPAQAQTCGAAGGDNRPALKLERMEPGTYEVELRLKGYATRSTKVTFEAGEVETVSLELKLK